MCQAESLVATATDLGDLYAAAAAGRAAGCVNAVLQERAHCTLLRSLPLLCESLPCKRPSRGSPGPPGRMTKYESTGQQFI